MTQKSTTIRSDSGGHEPIDQAVLAASDTARELVKLIDAALTARGSSEAAVTAWLRAGGKPLMLRGGGVDVDDVDCGAAGGGLGDWPKLLSDVGVLSLRPRRDITATALDVLRDALGCDAPEDWLALRGWLWSGGPFGLLFELGPPLWQSPARLGFNAPVRAELDRNRAAGVAHSVAAETVPWPEALAMVESVKMAQPGHLQHSHSLRLDADDASSWLKDCLRAYEPRPVGADASEKESEATSSAGSGGAHKDTAATENSANKPDLGDFSATGGMEIPNADHVAGVVKAQIAFGARLDLATVWVDLPNRETTLAAVLHDRLSGAEIGRVVGRTLPLNAERVQAIDALLEAGGDFAAGIASGLLMRAVNATTVDGVTALLRRLGLQRVWQVADLSGIQGKSARGLALVLKKLDAGATLWADLVGAAPPQVAAWILRGSPPHILSRVGGQLRIKLVAQPPHESAPLVEALVEMDAPGPLRAVGEALRETRGRDWSGTLVPAVCAALLKHHLGEEILVPLFLDREAEVPLRLLILRSLDADPALLEMATKFRLGELREPKQIQTRLKAARKKLKARR